MSDALSFTLPRATDRVKARRKRRRRPPRIVVWFFLDIAFLIGDVIAMTGGNLWAAVNAIGWACFAILDARRMLRRPQTPADRDMLAFGATCLVVSLVAWVVS